MVIFAAANAAEWLPMSALDLDSPFDAITLTLREHGHRFFTGCGVGSDDAHYRVVVVQRDPTVGSAGVEGRDQSRWSWWVCTVHTEKRWHGEGLQRGARRLGMLVEALDVLDGEQAVARTAVEVLTVSAPARPREFEGVRQAMLAAWWDEQVAAGQSGEAARFLLELTLPSQTLHRLTYDRTGVPRLGGPFGWQPCTRCESGLPTATPRPVAGSPPPWL